MSSHPHCFRHFAVPRYPAKYRDKVPRLAPDNTGYRGISKTLRTIRRRQTLPAIRRVEADAWIAKAGETRLIENLLNQIENQSDLTSCAA